MIEGTGPWLLSPGEPARPIAPPSPEAVDRGPLVSCIMPTRGRLEPAIHAIDCFLRQNYRDRELVIVCATPESEVAAHVRTLADPRIRMADAGAARHAGQLRNAGIAAAAGRFVCTWDDDDLSHPQRIVRQVAALGHTGAAACFLGRVTLWWPARRLLATSSTRLWENSMLAERAAVPRFGDEVRGSDTPVCRAMRAERRLVMLGDPGSYVYIAHGGNLWSEAHFTMLFANAAACAEGSAYSAAVAALAPELPLAAYAGGLAGEAGAIPLPKAETGLI